MKKHLSNRTVQILIGGFFAIIVLLTICRCDVASSKTIERSVTFHWTAVGADSLIGTADHYDFRYFTDVLDDHNWDSAMIINQVPIPSISGTAESTVVDLIVEQETFYYFAIKAVDEYGHSGKISNIVSIIWHDKISPAQITDLRASDSSDYEKRLK